MLTLILLILAVACLTAAALGVTARHVHLGWLGLALFMLMYLIPKL